MATPNSNTPLLPDEAYTVTASATTRFSPSAIYVGTTGNVTIYLVNGGTATFLAIPSGSVVPCLAIGIHTDTTATGLVRIA